MRAKLIDVRMSLGYIFEAGQKYGKFLVRPLIEKGSDNEHLVRDVIEKVGSEKFGPKWSAVKKVLSAGNKLVLQDGDTKADEYPEYKNTYYLNAKSDARPLVAGRDGRPVSKEDNVFYPGCRVDVIIDLFAHSNDFGSFVLVQLLGVQFRRNDTRLTAGTTVSQDDFMPITAGADEDPIE